MVELRRLYRHGPWKGLADVEFATLEWVAAMEGREAEGLRRLQVDDRLELRLLLHGEDALLVTSASVISRGVTGEA